MKLKDILKTDTDNTGWLKTFKKLGADREMLQYVNNNITKEGGGDGVGSSSKYSPRYFSIDWNKADEDWKNLLSFETVMYKISSITKINYGYGIFINTYGVPVEDSNKILAFSFQPLYISKYYSNMLGIGEYSIYIDTIEKAILIINKMLEISGQQVFNISMNGITEITEEEFYTI